MDVLSTKRYGEEQNRESFKEARDKAIFEKDIDTKREQVAEEKAKKEEKWFVREERRKDREKK